MPSKFLVYSEDGNTSRWYGREAIADMLHKQIIEPRPGGRIFKFRPKGSPPLCGRTYVARRGLLAAIGRSQVYTIAGKFGFGVSGHKRLYREDRRFFIPWELRL
jgi:hypothetical protein